MTNIQRLVPSQIEAETRPFLHAHKQRKTKELAATMAFSRAQSPRNFVNYYHDLRRLRTILLCKKTLENLLMGTPKYDQTIAVSGGKVGCTPFIEFIFRVIAET